jgi:predicted MFS family arabinose efflux permease
MTPHARNLALLAGCQALLFTNNVTLISMQGLTGFALASNKTLATLPVTAYIVGAALTTLPASLAMKRLGRRRGFLLGVGVGVVGALIATLAMSLHHFWLLCAGSLVLGVYNAFGQFYRFAAADAVPSAGRARAISLVLAGGLVGGIVGPELSKYTRTLAETEFLAAYASLVLFCVLAAALISRLDLPRPSAEESSGTQRPLATIMRQPAFITAVAASAIGYGVMNFLMTATPLAMGMCGLPYASAATVISWHVIAMFAPSFYTGTLISRFGAEKVILAGIALMFACVAVALSGQALAQFWWALVLLGLGWNFMYVGGSSLLGSAHRASEKAKAQGMHDFLVFCTTSTSSFASGVLIKANGWALLNQIALPFLLVAAALVTWWWVTKPKDEAMA